jgi:PEP-CTERM motif-containing protein
MKTTSRIALLAAVALGMAASTQAQSYVNGDLLLGFSGGANDFIYDLGSFSSLVQGETWSVGANLGTVFGVVGASGGTHHIYATSSDAAENSFDPTGLYSGAAANVTTISGSPTAVTVGGTRSRTTTATDTTGWTFQTHQPPGTPGNTFQNNFFDPNVSASGTAYFFDNNNLGAVAAHSFFTYNSANGIVTFGAVPEPSTYGLLAGAGLLGLALRRQYTRRA